MKITEGQAEVVGMYLGDGYIYKDRNKNRYQIGFVGSPKTDIGLFERLRELIKKEWGKDVKFGTRARGLRMVFRLKEMSDFFIKDLGLPFGEGKCERIKIPPEIYGKWNLAKKTIRGFMDTDGSVFVSKKPGIERYPTMEITTTSRILANQLRPILLEKGFRVTNIRASTSKLSKRMAYRVPLHGRKNLKKWLEEIGFSNKYKLDRAKNYIQ